MYEYIIAGKRIRTEKKLTDQEIDEIEMDIQGLSAQSPATQANVSPDVPTPENITSKKGYAPELLTREYLSPMETAIETIPMVTGTIGSFYGPVVAAIGGAGGEVARQVLTQDADPTKVLQTGLTEAVLTKGGDLVGNLLGRYLNIPRGVPGIEEAQTAQQTLEQGGGTLSGVQAGQGGLGGTLERLSRGSLLGSPQFEALNERNLTSLSNQIDELVSARTGGEMSLSDTARGITETIEAGFDALKTGYSDVTAQIWNQVPGTLNGTSVKNSIDSVLETHTKPVSGDPTAIGPTYARVVSTLQKLPDNPTAKEINENLQLIRGLERGMSKELGANTKELQRVGELIDAAENGFANQLKSVDMDLYKSFKDAQLKYGRYKSELFPDVLTPIFKSAKKDAYQSIGQSLARPTTSVDQIKGVKKALARAAKLNRSLDADSALKTLQESYIRGMFGSPKSLGDIAAVADRLSGRAGKAQLETMRELLGPETAQRVRNIANAAKKTLEGTKGEGPLQLALGSRQVGAFEAIAGGTAGYQLFQGDPTSAIYASGILLAPVFIAKVATSPTMTKRVITMLSSKKPFPAKAAEQILTRMVYELGINPEDFEGTQVDINNLRQRIKRAEERKSGQMARNQ